MGDTFGGGIPAGERGQFIDHFDPGQRAGGLPEQVGEQLEIHHQVIPVEGLGLDDGPGAPAVLMGLFGGVGLKVQAVTGTKSYFSGGGVHIIYGGEGACQVLLKVLGIFRILYIQAHLFLDFFSFICNFS